MILHEVCKVREDDHESSVQGLNTSLDNFPKTLSRAFWHLLCDLSELVLVNLDLCDLVLHPYIKLLDLVSFTTKDGSILLD